MTFHDDDPLADERDAARDARDQTLGADIDRPTRREAEDDENPPPYRIEDDPYRGVCGGCHRPVSAFAGHEGGHEGACLWRGGVFHPSCRAADPEYIAYFASFAARQSIDEAA